MRIGDYHFEPRLVPTLVAAAAIAVLACLSHWQWNRMDEKQARQALLEGRVKEPPVRLTSVDGDEVIYRRVVVEGRYVAESQIFIDNRQHLGRAGFHVITPLKLAGGGNLLVNRGWVARNADYPKAPGAPVPEGVVVVTGLAATPPGRFVELSPQAFAGNVWQNFSIARYRQRTNVDVMPFVVLAAPASPGLVAVEEKPDAGAARNQEYALTWLSLALTVLILWIVVNVRRAKP